MQVLLDKRMMALGAILAAGTEESERPESAMARQTRVLLSAYASHPRVRWFREQLEKYELLTLAMQVEQLDGPPGFAPHAPGEIPGFVDMYFSMVPRDKISQGLTELWDKASLESLFEAQRSQWQEALDDIAAALHGVPVEDFQRLFFGHFPYKAVAVPAANMPNVGVIAVGTADTRESRAVCCPYGQDRYSEHAADLVVVAQHEASHVVVDDIQSLRPGVTEQCFFVEETYPAAGKFATSYRDPGFRFVETLIRASTCFFLEYLGKEEAAAEFRRSQLEAGVSGIGVFVDALRPWWKERTHGRSGGLEARFTDLPGLLRAAV